MHLVEGNMASGASSPELSMTPTGAPTRVTTPAVHGLSKSEVIKICVFCGASRGKNPAHGVSYPCLPIHVESADRRVVEAARQLAKMMAARGAHLVYGGGTNGLMGEVAKTLVSLSGPQSVHGIIPAPLVKYECAETNPAVTHDQPEDPNGVALPAYRIYGRTTTVKDMHTRKSMMAQEVMAGAPGSGFIALTGGYGTLEELMEVVTWNQLGIHGCGIIALNIDGYWDGLLAWIRGAVEKGFVAEGNASIIVEAKSAKEAIEALANYQNSDARFKLEWGNQ